MTELNTEKKIESDIGPKNKLNIKSNMTQNNKSNIKLSATHHKTNINTDTAQRTELEKRDILRMSNEESNRLTKECLQTALIYLMGEKPFEKITITELVRRSGISRSGFYRNYSSKEDIIIELSNNIIQILTKSLNTIHDEESLHQWFYQAFQKIQENDRVFRLLLQSNLTKESFLGNDFSLEKVFPPDSLDNHYKLRAVEGAFINILVTWFHSGQKESCEYMASLCCQILGSFLLPLVLSNSNFL